MKRKLFYGFVCLVVIVLSISLISCGVSNTTNKGNTNSNEETNNNTNTDNSGNTGNSGSTDSNETINYPDPVSDTTITADETTADFTIVTDVENGYTIESNIVSITAPGEYTISGYLNGQILINTTDSVTLNLSNVTIEYSNDSPIKNIGEGDLDISAKKDTENVIKDTRSAKQIDDENQGEGAVYSNTDLKLKGTGTLVIEAGYNNGIHTKDDLKIQKLSLKVTAGNNALKGKDSITIESGNIVLISTSGDGIKTDNTSISSKGNQKGNIEILGGNISIYAAGDGIQAAYNFVLSEEQENIETELTIYTGSYSSYTKSNSGVDSYKGVKAENEIIISGGLITINSYDDGLHANYGTTLENGSSGLGNISINGGIVNIGVYSPTKSTGGGNWGPRGGSQTSVSGADGIHADNTISINDGTVNIDTAYEAIEATIINFNGGKTTIYGTDDGVNAAKKINKTPQVNVTGGYLDITIATGDTDGIDSNGNYTQTGGVVITRGAPNSTNNMATGLDCDGTASITGGTFVQFGSVETTLNYNSSNVKKLSFGAQSGGMGGGPRMGGSTSTSSSYTFSSGTWYLSQNQSLFSAKLTGNYYGCTIYSSSLSSGSYTITNGNTSYSATAQ